MDLQWQHMVKVGWLAMMIKESMSKLAYKKLTEEQAKREIALIRLWQKEFNDLLNSKIV